MAKKVAGDMTTSPNDWEWGVFVVESPRPDDAFAERSEMGALRLVGQLDQIPVDGKTALDRPHFELALGEAVYAFIARLRRPYVLCLHIGAHGDKNGIELTDGSVITWPQLRQLLVPLCRNTAGLLLLSMASCEGLNAKKSAWALTGLPGVDELPFLAVVGSAGKPVWSETALGYATLYHHLKAGSSMDDAVGAMQRASGHQGFAWVRADREREEFQRGFEAYLDSLWSARQEAGEQQVGGPASTTASQ